MAGKMPISNTELVWKIIELMRANTNGPLGSSVAVVADEKLGWRAILGKRKAARMSPESAKWFADIQKQLRSKYTLRVE